MSRGVKKEVEGALGAALSDLGYARVEKQVFRAPWSTETVDHYVCLRWLPRYGPRLSVEIGIRHREAQDFAVEILRKHGPLPLRDLIDVGKLIEADKHGCLHRTKLEALRSGPFPWSLDLAELGAETSVEITLGGLQETLVPMVASIGDDPAMYGFLTQKLAEAHWPPHGAARAAEAIFIGKRLSYPQARIFADIEAFEEYIPSQIDDALTVEDFLNEVWARA